MLRVQLKWVHVSECDKIKRYEFMHIVCLQLDVNVLFCMLMHPRPSRCSQIWIWWKAQNAQMQSVCVVCSTNELRWIEIIKMDVPPLSLFLSLALPNMAYSFVSALNSYSVKHFQHKGEYILQDFSFLSFISNLFSLSLLHSPFACMPHRTLNSHYKYDYCSIVHLFHISWRMYENACIFAENLWSHITIGWLVRPYDGDKHKMVKLKQKSYTLNMLNAAIFFD